MPDPGFTRPDLCPVPAADAEAEPAGAVRGGLSADGYLPAGDWGWWYTSTTETYQGAWWPDDVLYGVAANSSHYGYSPTIGTCPSPPLPSLPVS